MLGVAVFALSLCSVWCEYVQDEGDSMVGDMRLTPQQRMFIETGIASRGTVTKPWPNNEVPYVIDGSVAGARGVIMSAMEEWSRKTCIRFKPRTNERGFIRFFAEKGCWSNVGHQGYEQRISLQARGCWHHGIVVHEIGHALGFWHEQNRQDRDTYVTIHHQNIQPDARSNFFKLRSTSTSTPYDYGSIMHYGAKDFTINGKLTIEVKRKGVTFIPTLPLFRLDSEMDSAKWTSCRLRYFSNALLLIILLSASSLRTRTTPWQRQHAEMWILSLDVMQI